MPLPILNNWSLNVTCSTEQHPDAYLEPCQISKMDHFEKIVNVFECFILDVWQGCEYVSDIPIINL